jgi:hypothetical protein
MIYEIGVSIVFITALLILPTHLAWAGVNNKKHVKIALNAKNDNKVKHNNTKIGTLNKYVIVVDYSLPSNVPRMFIINTESEQIERAFLVSHGKASGGKYATKFSNVVGSNMSSLGIYMSDVYYHGKHGLSIKLDGLSKTNSNARQRYIVIHEADYVKTGGRSHGCFAVEPKNMTYLLKLLIQPTLIVVVK